MSRHHQLGFNLIEVLIALVVLTLGLLGIAAMQLTTIRNTQGSYYRSQATTIANDLAERIHVNRLNFANYVFNPPSAPANCPGAEPASVPIAPYDIYDVACGANGASRQLTSGNVQTFCINTASSVEAACTSEPNMRMQINVNWTERSTAKTGGSASAMNAESLENQTLTLIIQP